MGAAGARHWASSGAGLALIGICCSTIGYAGASSAGSEHCPCLPTTDPLYTQIAAQTAQSALPAGYGLSGCDTHDMPRSECQNEDPMPRWCTQKWCYVDPVLCARQETACLSEGLKINDPSSTNCRSRPMFETRLLNMSGAYYSYGTCFSLNSYDDARLTERVKDTVIVSTTTQFLPWTKVEEPTAENPEYVYSGIEVQFFREALKHHEPSIPELRLSPDWASKNSSDLFGSSYTACVHDVAVGHYDMCLGDFWQTPERMLMSPFLPPVRTDFFYLVLPVQETRWTVYQMVIFPFEPFTPGAWALISGVIAMKAVSKAFTDWDNQNEFEYEPDAYAPRFLKAFYLSFASFLSKQLNVHANSAPAKIGALGYQFFILLMLAFYTASLTSILVNQEGRGEVNSIEDAIKLDYKICVPSAATKNIELNYPQGDYFSYSGSTADFARHIHSKKCQCAVIHEQRFWHLQAGQLKEKDCQDVADGKATEEDARCKTGFDGLERDDCKFTKVGPAIMSIPIAFPVSEEMYLPLAWAMTKAMAEGKWEQTVSDSSKLFPVNVCEVRGEASVALDAQRIAGVCLITAISIMLGLMLWIIETKVGSKSETWIMKTYPEQASTDELIMERLSDIHHLMRDRAYHDGHIGKQGGRHAASREGSPMGAARGFRPLAMFNQSPLSGTKGMNRMEGIHIEVGTLGEGVPALIGHQQQKIETVEPADPKEIDNLVNGHGANGEQSSGNGNGNGNGNITHNYY